MKKIILSVTAIAGFSVAAFAQGTITFDGSNNTSTSPTAPSSGLVFIDSGSGAVLDTTTDINAELLYSATGVAGTFTSVVTLLLSSSAAPTDGSLGQSYASAGDITFWANGQLQDQSGQSYVIPTIAAGSTAFFEVMGWTGVGATYGAQGTAFGTSSVFSEVLSASTSPVQANIEGMPALVLNVPEPTTMAMAGLGGLSLLFLRRKK